MADLSIKQIASVLSFLGMIAVGIFYVEDRYFHEKDGLKVELKVATIEKDLEVHVLTEQLDQKQQRIYQYQDRLEAHPHDPVAKERLRDLKEEKDHLEKALDDAKSKTD